MKQRLRAFSLVELSIVIVIIGTLIAGILRSSRIAYEGRLQAARGITKSAPVSSIKGLTLWLETTLEDSFLETEMVDGTQLTVWKDINPQVQFGLFALKLATDGAIYSEKGVNTLPSIVLAGSAGDSAFRLSHQSDPTVSENTSIGTRDNEYTFFIVAKTNSFSNAENYLFMNGNFANASNSYYVTSAGARVVKFPDSVPTTVATADGNDDGHPTIISGTYKKDDSSSGTIKLYANGAEISSSTISTLNAAADAEFSIGAKDYSDDSGYWEGFLSEFIYYDNKLSDKKRKEIEKYLSRKYLINIVEES